MGEVPLFVRAGLREGVDSRSLLVRTGSWMGPPQGYRAPRVVPIIIVILARE